MIGKATARLTWELYAAQPLGVIHLRGKRKAGLLEAIKRTLFAMEYPQLAALALPKGNA